jgi:hypothetical protein
VNWRIHAIAAQDEAGDASEGEIIHILLRPDDPGEVNDSDSD